MFCSVKPSRFIILPAVAVAVHTDTELQAGNDVGVVFAHAGGLRRAARFEYGIADDSALVEAAHKAAHKQLATSMPAYYVIDMPQYRSDLMTIDRKSNSSVLEFPIFPGSGRIPDEANGFRVRVKLTVRGTGEAPDYNYDIQVNSKSDGTGSWKKKNVHQVQVVSPSRGQMSLAEWFLSNCNVPGSNRSDLILAMAMNQTLFTTSPTTPFYLILPR